MLNLVAMVVLGLCTGVAIEQGDAYSSALLGISTGMMGGNVLRDLGRRIL